MSARLTSHRKLAIGGISAELLAFVFTLLFNGFFTLVFLALSIGMLASIRLVRPPPSDAAEKSSLDTLPPRRAQPVVAGRIVDTGNQGEAGSISKRPDRFELEAEKAHAEIRIQRCHTIVTIHDTGDAIYDENFYDVEPFRVPELRVINGFVISEYAYYNSPVYEPNDIAWNWGKQEGDKRYAFTSFKKPLRLGEPQSFNRKRRSFNFVYFNQQDRGDSLWSKSGDPTRERVRFQMVNAYHRFLVQVVFPPDRFPNCARAEVYSAESEQPEQSETARAQRAFTPLSDPRILQLDIPNPLCGYIYQISWDLPTAEADEVGLTPQQRSFFDDAARRLRTEGKTVSEACNELCKVLQKSYTDERMGVIVYAYLRAFGRGGLSPVADTNGLLVSLDQNALVRLGRTLPGQSYRRRSDILFSSSRHKDDTGYEKLPAFNGPEPTFAIAVPISCPEPGGLRLGVVYVQSHSATSKLNALVDDRDAKARFVRAVHIWHVQKLMPSLFPEIPADKPDELPWLWNGKPS